jgi:hypothetical protein
VGARLGTALEHTCMTWRDLTIGLMLLILVILFLVGGLPRWGYHSYGYGPSGIAGVLVIVCVGLLLTGRL